jgi:hypothetical protein
VLFMPPWLGAGTCRLPKLSAGALTEAKRGSLTGRGRLGNVERHVAGFFGQAWNSAIGQWLEAEGWGPTLDGSGFNV